MTKRIPTNWKICATCSHWCGKQSTDTLCVLVEYDDSEKAKCVGGGFNMCNMDALATCNKWNQRFKK